jgi:two-component system, OmpR family, sensor kinase
VSFMWWSGGALLAVGVGLAVGLARGRFWLVDRAVEGHEQFLHDTAHELRTPLTTLQAIVGAGLAGDVAPREALGHALRVIQGTDEVVADLMTLTRIETGRAPLAAERFRLDLLVEALASQRTDDPPVQVRVRPTVVSANAELVRRAVGNLIDNAVRHGRAADKEAEVTVEVGERRVVVSDRGPGVAPQLLPHVVERVTTGRRRSGSGLGLAIAGWVARIHGGQLTAANRRPADAGSGAEFTLELPE